MKLIDTPGGETALKETTPVKFLILLSVRLKKPGLV
jgi:hypothetical protein